MSIFNPLEKHSFLTFSSSKTKSAGKKLAHWIIKRPLRKEAFVIGLIGELGSGKTTFSKGLAEELGVKQKILSPTFVILKKFRLTNKKFKHFYHIDCYRIKHPKEIADLGLDKIISNPKNVICIEWAGRIKKLLPNNTVYALFSFGGKNRRRIKFNFDSPIKIA